MTILIVTGIFPPDIGGPASYVPKIAKELVERGYIVKVLCLSDSLNHDDCIYPFRLLRIRRGLFKPYRMVMTILKIINISSDADVIYVNGLHFETTIAKYFISKPFIHKVVGDFSWERATSKGWYSGTLVEYQQTKKGLLFKTLDWIRNFPLKRADKIIVPSAYLKKILVGWRIESSKIIVVYNSVVNSSDEEKTVDYQRPSYKTIITVCRLISLKKVDEIIRVLKELSNVNLLVVGDGPMRQEWEALAKSIGVYDRVTFTGQVPSSHIKKYLNQADCFVLNSTHEGLPHVILEAMDTGLPVIATNVGGVREIIEHNITGKLISSGDNEALKDAILSVLNDKDEAVRLASAAKEKVSSKFSYDIMVKKTEEILLNATDDNISMEGR